MYTLGVIFTVIFIILISISIVRITYVFRHRKDPTSNEIDLKKIGHDMGFGFGAHGDPGDPEMTSRIEKKLKNHSKL